MNLIASLFNDSNQIFALLESMRFIKLHQDGGVTSQLALAAFFIVLGNVSTGGWQQRLTNSLQESSQDFLLLVTIDPHMVSTD